jgi:hypothetical protein
MPFDTVGPVEEGRQDVILPGHGWVGLKVSPPECAAGTFGSEIGCEISPKEDHWLVDKYSFQQ